jgi:hypothetical protein
LALVAEPPTRFLAQARSPAKFSFMVAGKYWWMKVVALVLALAGVLWVMSTLQDGSYVHSPNSPVQMLMGSEPGTTSQPAGIPAKVQFEKPSEAAKPSK